MQINNNFNIAYLIAGFSLLTKLASATNSTTSASYIYSNGTDHSTNAVVTVSTPETLYITDMSTTVIDICTRCENPKTTVGYYLTTSIISGVVTEYTTFCPTTTATDTTVIESSTYTGNVIISSVTSGIFTVVTEYLPVTSTVH